MVYIVSALLYTIIWTCQTFCFGFQDFLKCLTHINITIDVESKNSAKIMDGVTNISNSKKK